MMAEDNTALRTWQCLQMLLYTCTLIKVTRPHIVNPLEFAAKQANCNRSKHKMKVQRVPLKRVYRSASKMTGCEPDVNAAVFVSEKNAICLGLKRGQWQNVAYCHENPAENGVSKDPVNDVRRRWIMVEVNADVPEDQCYVSPLLFHNLQQGNDSGEVFIEFDSNYDAVLSDAVRRILILWKYVHRTDISNACKSIVQYSPDVASEVHVQVVESTKYKCGSELEPLLKGHFRIPKLISVEDVLVVPIPSHLAEEFIVSNSLIPPKYIFIKISGVKGKYGSATKQCVIMKMGITNLYLAGTTQCCLPLLTESFDDEGDLDVPPILKENFVKVKKVLQMEMKERRQVSPVVYSNLHHKGSKNTNTKVSSDILHSKAIAHHFKDNEDIEKCVCEAEDGSADGVTILLLGQPGCGSKRIIKLAASALGLGVLWTNSWHLKGDASGGTEARVQQAFLRAKAQGPCVFALLNIHCISKDRDGGEDARVVSTLREEIIKLSRENTQVLLVATAPDRTSVSDDLWSVWSYQECVQVPDLGDRTIMLDWLLSKWVPEVQTQSLAQRTAGYVLGDFQALITAARRHCLWRLSLKHDSKMEELSKSSVYIENTRDLPLLYTDLLKALDELQSIRSEALGAPRIPQVRWNEVGGLEDAKRQVINTIQLPLRHPSLVSSRLRRSGVLLYGPPGTGKTLLAKAVATECGLNFMSVKGPELLNMYVGQSEENVRQVFARAHAAAPCVIFFDELDSLAPNRGRSGDSGGVMDRIVSALLAELDGVSSAADVFVLAATNRPDLIDPGLLRPGRFEKLVFLGVCEDRANQIKVLKAVTSKIPLGSSVKMEKIAELLPLTLTGADLYALCTDALYAALHRITTQILAGVVQEENAVVVVEEEDFNVAAEKLVPSVTPGELAHYRTLTTITRT
nr:peroxisome assembly factor 2-like [Procambarus clarkii]XP_045604146.1 peroxisome assembly factor 2-like [Procambarus clarkii]